MMGGGYARRTERRPRAASARDHLVLLELLGPVPGVDVTHGSRPAAHDERLGRRALTAVGDAVAQLAGDEGGPEAAASLTQAAIGCVRGAVMWANAAVALDGRI